MLKHCGYNRNKKRGGNERINALENIYYNIYYFTKSVFYNQNAAKSDKNENFYSKFLNERENKLCWTAWTNLVTKENERFTGQTDDGDKLVQEVFGWQRSLLPPSDEQPRHDPPHSLSPFLHAHFIEHDNLVLSVI